MKKAKDLLVRWEQVVPDSFFLRSVLPAIVKKRTRAEIEPSSISVKNQTVFIKASPLIKTEIFIKKSAILEDLTKEMGEKAPRDIK